MAQIQHELKIRASSEKIRKALVSADAVQAWHGGSITSQDHTLRVSFDDGPTFRWHVTDDAANNRVTWKCVEGPGDSVGTEATFAITPADKGRHQLEFAHLGWPNEGGSFRKCNTMWAVLLHQLRQYVETGNTAPFLR